MDSVLARHLEVTDDCVRPLDKLQLRRKALDKSIARKRVLTLIVFFCQEVLKLYAFRKSDD